jgi:hypothetical protein
MFWESIGARCFNVFFTTIAVSAYCGGHADMNLVNVKEIRLEHVNSIEVLYRWEALPSTCRGAFLSGFHREPQAAP